MRDAFGIERVLTKRRLVKHDQRALQKHREQQGEAALLPLRELMWRAFGTVGQTEVRQRACYVLYAELGQFFSHCVKEKMAVRVLKHIHHLLARFNLLQRFFG